MGTIHHLADLAYQVTLHGKELREDQTAAIGEQGVKMRRGGEYLDKDLTDGEVLRRMLVVILLPLASMQDSDVVAGSTKELLEITEA